MHISILYPPFALKLKPRYDLKSATCLFPGLAWEIRQVLKKVAQVARIVPILLICKLINPRQPRDSRLPWVGRVALAHAE